MMDTIENKYVEITKISEYFGVSNTTVRSWVRDNKIPRDSYIKIPSDVGNPTFRYNLASIEAHFTEGEQDGE